MKTLFYFLMLVGGIALIGFGFLVVGWWILLPAVIGGLWGIARGMAHPKRA
jgi:hypothetical protein